MHFMYVASNATNLRKLYKSFQSWTLNFETFPIMSYVQTIVIIVH